MGSNIIEMLRLGCIAVAAPDNINRQLLNDWPTTGAAVGVPYNTRKAPGLSLG